MAKVNPLQEQLIRAGLTKKSKAAEVAREQNKARQGKGPAAASSEDEAYYAQFKVPDDLVW